jgi:hypothetical protein
MFTTSKSEMPKSCKENWLELNTEEKYRFCTLCQKNIFLSEGESDDNLDGICLKYSSSQTENESSKSKWLTKVSEFLIYRKTKKPS